MPDIIGDTGFELNYRNEELLYSTIHNMLNSEHLEQMSEASRKRVVNNYSFERRKTELINLLT